MMGINVATYRQFESHAERATAFRKWLKKHDKIKAELMRDIMKFIERSGRKKVSKEGLQVTLSRLANPTYDGLTSGYTLELVELVTGESWRLKSDIRPAVIVDIQQSQIVDNAVKLDNKLAEVRLYKSQKGSTGGSFIMVASVATAIEVPQENLSVPNSFFAVELPFNLDQWPAGSIITVNRLRRPITNRYIVLESATLDFRVVGLLLEITSADWVMRIDGKKRSFSRFEFPIALPVDGISYPKE